MILGLFFAAGGLLIALLLAWPGDTLQLSETILASVSCVALLLVGTMRILASRARK